MATLEQRIKASTRRGSAIAIQSNPIETGTAEKAVLKVENLSDCRTITGPECEVLLEKLKTSGNNEAILITLETEKVPFVFTSDSLARLLTCTTSVKTRLTMILTIAPRLSDPRAKMSVFTDMFRFSEEKAQIEDAFKVRIQAMNGSLFKRESSSILSSPAGRGGRGRGAALSPGRGDAGGAGRGAGALLAGKPRAVSLPVGHKLDTEAIGVQKSSEAAVDNDSDDDSDDGHCPIVTARPFSMSFTPTVFSKAEEAAGKST